MSLDVIRIKKYLHEITRGGGELKALVLENQLKPGEKTPSKKETSG